MIGRLSFIAFLLAGVLFSSGASAQTADARARAIPYGPDSERQAGVPRGAVTQHRFESKVFAETKRDYWVYVPAQYDPKKPAALMVFQDGQNYVKEDGGFRVPVVFDNLIRQGAMPVTIAVLIAPGHKGEAPPGNAFKRNNRSFEYDTLSGDYVRFLIEEIIPEVEKNYTLTDARTMRAICGSSSGGICAFTAAWQRPDYFHKVLSFIGSFTNIRGGHNYPALIRKGEIRNIKVFLQDGSHDLDNAHGNWWLGNQQMAAALKFRDYDYKTAWGAGGHNSKEAGPLFPESLKWLWRAEAPGAQAGK